MNKQLHQTLFCCYWGGARTPLHVLRCTLHAARCTSHVARYTLQVTRCTLHVTHYTIHVARYMLHVTRYTLHVARYTLHVTRYTSHVTRYSSEINDHLHQKRSSMGACMRVCGCTLECSSAHAQCHLQSIEQQRTLQRNSACTVSLF